MKKIIIIILLLCSSMLFSQKISELPEATTAGLGNLFLLVQSGVTKKITYENLVSTLSADTNLINEDSLIIGGYYLPLTVTTIDYESKSGSEAVAFTDLGIWNDTLDLGSAVGRDDDMIYVMRTDYNGNAVIINASPAIYYKATGYTQFRIDKNMVGCVLQSDGSAWYMAGIWYDDYYRSTLFYVPDTMSIGGYTSNAKFNCNGTSYFEGAITAPGIAIEPVPSTDIQVMIKNGDNDKLIAMPLSNFTFQSDSAGVGAWKSDTATGVTHLTDSTDRVGIGNKDPKSRLHVGNGNFYGATSGISLSDGSTRIYLKSQNSFRIDISDSVPILQHNAYSNYYNYFGYLAGGLSPTNHTNGFGNNALQYNLGTNSNGMGNDVMSYNTGYQVNAIGCAAAGMNNGSGCQAIGESALSNNDGNNNTAIGTGAFNTWTANAAAEKTFDYTNINGDTITITAHGFGSAGSYKNLKYTRGSGTDPGGLSTNSKYQFEILDVNRVVIRTGHITSPGTSIGSKLTPQYIYSNSSALGNNAEPTASNQIMLGDADITQVKTSGQYISSISTGTSPFVVASTTVNTNLNADLLDGYHGTWWADSDTNRLITTTQKTRVGIFVASDKILAYKTIGFNSIYNNTISYGITAIDWRRGNLQSLTLNSSATLYFSQPPPSKCLLSLQVNHDASTTAYAITFPGTVVWNDGDAYTSSTTANDVDIINFFYDGTNYYGSFIHQASTPDTTNYARDADKLDGQHAAYFAEASHSHAQSDIAGLADSLLNHYTKSESNSRYAAASHTHAQSNITGLADSLLNHYTKAETENIFAPKASPTFTGTPDLPLNFEINNVAMTSTAAELNYLDGAGSVGYSIPVLAGGTTTPLDATTYYVGNSTASASITATNRSIYILRSGTITAAVATCLASTTAGSNENWTVYIRKNNTTDYEIATVGANTTIRNWVNTGLNISVSAGDFIEIKHVTPTWATDPVAIFWSGYIYVRTP
jgi:hypothetical protein